MPFREVSGVGLVMGVLNFGGDRRRERDSFGGEFGASHCNQWGVYCIVVWKCIQRLSCRLAWWVGGPRHRGIHVLDGCPRTSREGLFLAWFLAFFGIWARIRFNGRNNVLIADRFVCEKLTIFPYTEYIVEIYVSLAFLWCSQIQDRNGGWREMHVQKHNT